MYCQQGWGTIALMADSSEQPVQTPETQTFQPTSEATQSVASPAPLASLTTPPEDIVWTASEFIAHEKTTSWYVMLGGIAIVVAALLYALFRDPVTSGVVLVAALFLGYYGSHEPRQVRYGIDRRGVTIGSKQYPYGAFRSFSVIPEGAFSAIVFMPLKRFAVPLTIYYAPDDEDRIVALLSEELPFEHRKPDVIDALMRRIRF